MKLYHICREEDIGNYLVGYIGVTSRKNITTRWYEHNCKSPHTRLNSGKYKGKTGIDLGGS